MGGTHRGQLLVEPVSADDGVQPVSEMFIVWFVGEQVGQFGQFG